MGFIYTRDETDIWCNRLAQFFHIPQIVFSELKNENLFIAVERIDEGLYAERCIETPLWGGHLFPLREHRFQNFAHARFAETSGNPYLERSVGSELFCNVPQHISLVEHLHSVHERGDASERIRKCIGVCEHKRKGENDAVLKRHP